MISSPAESLIILVSGNISIIAKFERGHPEQGQFLRLGGYELAILAIFRPINHRISETVQDRTKVAMITNIKIAYALSIGSLPKLTTLDDCEDRRMN